MALYLNKLETTSSKDALCQVCMKLAKWFKKEVQNVKRLQTKMTTSD